MLASFLERLDTLRMHMASSVLSITVVLCLNDVKSYFLIIQLNLSITNSNILKLLV